MGLLEEFNDKSPAQQGYTMSKRNKYTLTVTNSYESGWGGGHSCEYDFLARVVLVPQKEGLSVVPFSQLDTESLELFRRELIRLNGTPPALPGQDSSRKNKLDKTGLKAP